MHGVLPEHIRPTRDKTCLNHAMVKIEKSNSKADILILDSTITDHYMVLFKLSSVPSQQTVLNTKSTTNYEKAISNLLKEDLTNLYPIKGPNVLADLIIINIRKCLLENTITTLVPRSNRIIKPWITLGVLRCIRNRNDMQRKLRIAPHNYTLKITYKR